MAWIVSVPPSPRHPYERYQVRYQDGKRQRSAGIFRTKPRALAEQRAIERGRPQELPAPTDLDQEKARTLFGEYVTTTWWPAWKDQHPASAYGTRKKVEKRILPAFGDLPLGELDASTIGAWKAAMVAEDRAPQTVNTYLSLLGTILNAAVDDDYLARSPLVRKSGAGRGAATRNQPVPRREVWLTREQLDRLIEAIDARYRALVLVAALTGMRWGELAALRWDEPRLDTPLHDGAVGGPGRLRIARAISDPPGLEPVLPRTRPDPARAEPARGGRPGRLRGLLHLGRDPDRRRRVQPDPPQRRPRQAADARLGAVCAGHRHRRAGHQHLLRRRAVGRRRMSDHPRRRGRRNQ